MDETRENNDVGEDAMVLAMHNGKKNRGKGGDQDAESDGTGDKEGFDGIPS